LRQPQVSGDVGPPSGAQVVLSYGLGVDSSAALLSFLEDASSRAFPLDQLLVVTSMTGDEWPRTGKLVEEHILPRLRAAGVRYAQVARGGTRQADGIRVLSDTTAPTRLYLAGAYKLSDELTVAGTVPQVGGTRRCSMKFKGWVIDTYLEHFAPLAVRHAFGFEIGEQRRADDCQRHMPGRLAFGFEVGEQGRARQASEYDTAYRVAEFPLIDWGWDREACRRYIEQITGVPDWPKSACVYCPFAMTSKAGRKSIVLRYDTRPQAAIDALLLEWRALCLNPRGGLIAGERLIALLAEQRPALVEQFRAHLAHVPHSVYEVRRLWRPKRDDPLEGAHGKPRLAYPRPRPPGAVRGPRALARPDRPARRDRARLPAAPRRAAADTRVLRGRRPGRGCRKGAAIVWHMVGGARPRAARARLARPAAGSTRERGARLTGATARAAPRRRR
jgi:hypothetical protein